ncbi:MAG: type II toxin-antitoxin system PemK/MazF family toxin [Planctomycetes bacterium]|nr:type II toxin-antitoxin system PemK/MazF family toxin [Planctomycetota bacterium]
MCLAHFPFTDGTSAKLRPILIVSAAEYNRGEDVVAVPISSSPDPDDPNSVFVGDPEYSKAGLRCPSAIKWQKPTTQGRRTKMWTQRLGVL